MEVLQEKSEYVTLPIMNAPSRFHFLPVVAFLAILSMAVAWVGASHAVVQGVMIFVMAVFFFLGQKLWVFRT